MTDNQRPTHRGATRSFAWMALLLTGATLQACGPNGAAGSAGSKLRVYAADLSGANKTCEAPKITPAADQTTEAAMKVGTNGGWCGLPLYQSGPKPFDAGLLTARPAHGTAFIHQVGDESRIDYTPDHGYTGTDSFSVKLLPGNETVHVAVTVAAT